MKKNSAVILFALLLFALLLFATPVCAKHLFILSGQSNMVLLPTEETFIPAIIAQYGRENVIIVKDAQSGKGIENWDKNAWLWLRLKASVNNVTKNKQIHTVTFIWMQGEANGGQIASKNYEEKLLDLFSRVDKLFPRAKSAYVLGRITDWDMRMGEPGWMKIREIQQRIGERDTVHAWVNTDDLNGPTNDIHMIGENGFNILGERFAAASIMVTDRLAGKSPLSMQVATRLLLVHKIDLD